MPSQMGVDEVYSIVLYAIKKNQQGDLPPDSFNNIINVGSYSYFSYLKGTYQRYQPGRPIAPVEFGQNARIRESLTPFIQIPSALTIDTSGLTPFPDSYEMWDAMYYGIYKKRVKYIQQDRLDMHLNSRINPIARNPVFMEIYNGFQLYPVDIGQTQLSYIRSPKQIKWGFTFDIYGRPIFNSGISQDPEWLRRDMLEVITRALAIVGVSLTVPQVEQYSNEIKNAGQ